MTPCSRTPCRCTGPTDLQQHDTSTSAAPVRCDDTGHCSFHRLLRIRIDYGKTSLRVTLATPTVAGVPPWVLLSSFAAVVLKHVSPARSLSWSTTLVALQRPRATASCGCSAGYRVMLRCSICSHWRYLQVATLRSPPRMMLHCSSSDAGSGSKQHACCIAASATFQHDLLLDLAWPLRLSFTYVAISLANESNMSIWTR